MACTVLSLLQGLVGGVHEEVDGPAGGQRAPGAEQTIKLTKSNQSIMYITMRIADTTTM